MSNFSDERTESSGDQKGRPPFTVDLLADEIRRHKRLPHQVPRDPLQAAKWWIGMQRPASERYESPTRATVVGQKDLQRWITPYADRLIASFRKFIEMDARQREFVIAAVEDGVFYNGDEFEFFRLVYDETMHMRSIEPDEYRKAAVKRRGRLVANMTPMKTGHPS